MRRSKANDHLLLLVAAICLAWSRTMAGELSVSGTRFRMGDRPFNYVGLSFAFDHIVQIVRVLDAGAYPTYHHDMFQTGYGSPAVPPSGIPDPEFSVYHRQVFEFLRQLERYEFK